MRAPVLRETGRLELQAETAAELMSENPVSVNATATVREALAMLIDKGFSAAPVIDEAGLPIGVLSCSDLLIHDRESAERRRASGVNVQENSDGTLVRDLMTPSVFSVALDTSAAKVVKELLSLQVHHLFVVDDRGAVVGVISAMDILRHLQPS